MKIEIKTENDAFTENKEGEIARLLLDVAEYVKMGRHAGFLYDHNGNTVGNWEI